MFRSTTPSLIWSLTARADLIRLRDFIEPHNPEAAKNAAQSLNIIIQHSGIGTRLKDRHDRELFVPFGKRGSVIRYRIDADAIVILKIGHSLEERY